MTEPLQPEKHVTRARSGFFSNPEVQKVLRTACWALLLVCALALLYVFVSDAFAIEVFGRGGVKRHFARESEVLDIVAFLAAVLLAPIAVQLDRREHGWLRRLSFAICVLVLVYAARPQF
jgi:hypothetical protein